MGTYCYLFLKDRSDENIKDVNKELHRLKIWRMKKFNGVPYGAFVTKDQLQEDARFMNEEPEGLKQAPGLKRPITVEDLEQMFWNEIGSLVVKLSGGTDNRKLNQLIKTVEYCIKHKLVDTKKSRDYLPRKIKEYIA